MLLESPPLPDGGLARFGDPNNNRDGNLEWNQALRENPCCIIRGFKGVQICIGLSVRIL